MYLTHYALVTVHSYAQAYLNSAHDDHGYSDHSEYSHVDSGAGHTHGSGDTSILEQACALITEPAHAITEVFYSLLFDVLLIPVTILVYKRIREPKLRASIHREIDAEHGVVHHAHNMDNDPHCTNNVDAVSPVELIPAVTTKKFGWLDTV